MKRLSIREAKALYNAGKDVFYNCTAYFQTPAGIFPLTSCAGMNKNDCLSTPTAEIDRPTFSEYIEAVRSFRKSYFLSGSHKHEFYFTDEKID